MVAGRVGEAHELLQRCADQGWLFPESLAQFVDGHAGQNRALDMHLTFCAWLFPNLDSGDVAIAGLSLVLAGGVYRRGIYRATRLAANSLVPPYRFAYQAHDL